METQKNIFGGDEIAYIPSVSELLAPYIQYSMPSSEKVALAWCDHPHVHRFIEEVADIRDEEIIRLKYIAHIKAMQSAESFSRKCRDLQEDFKGQLREVTFSKEWYRQYINTGYWQRTRSEAIELHGDSCMFCNAKGALEVHHKTYKNLGAEPLTDLSPICGDCHRAHTIRQNKNDLPPEQILPDYPPQAVKDIFERELLFQFV